MKRVMLTLWDFLSSPSHSEEKVAPQPAVASRSQTGRSVGMQARYDRLVDDMKEQWGIRIHRWRNRTSGCAWELRGKSGHVDRMIESPYPKGPMSCAVFLHEVGHHAIGFSRYSPRCLEEYMAWEWALKTMEAEGLNVTDAVRKRRDDAVRYAVAKALRRGLRRIPEPLIAYMPEGRVTRPRQQRSRQAAG